MPVNYAILAFVTLSESYLLSVVCAAYPPELVFEALLLTSLSFAGVSIYALTTKHDITILLSFVWGSAFLMLGITMLMLFTTHEKAGLPYMMFGALSALCYVILDTQMIMRDKKYGISYDDYIQGALVLYVDFI